MSISALHPKEGPLSRGGYLIMAFDPRSGHLAVHGDIAYAEASFEEAAADAQDAAAPAAALVYRRRTAPGGRVRR
jgi:hypothetical protein